MGVVGGDTVQQAQHGSIQARWNQSNSSNSTQVSASPMTMARAKQSMDVSGCLRA